jgi:hypothetical protein
MKLPALLSRLEIAAALAACASPSEAGWPIDVALACTLPTIRYRQPGHDHAAVT